MSLICTLACAGEPRTSEHTAGAGSVSTATPRVEEARVSPPPRVAPEGPAPAPGLAEPAPVLPSEATAALPSSATWGGVSVALRGAGPIALVLLHGYGGSGDDMLPVADALASALPVRVAVPSAPREWLPGGGGRAWFERTATNADAQIDRARAEVEAIREGLVAEGREPAEVILAGFSQGASLALEVALTSTVPPRALVLFSGRILSRFAGRWDALRGVPVFVSHGRADPLIPFGDGERMDERARDAGAEVSFVPFEGGHELPPEIIARAIEFLRPRASEPVAAD